MDDFNDAGVVGETMSLNFSALGTISIDDKCLVGIEGDNLLLYNSDIGSMLLEGFILE